MFDSHCHITDIDEPLDCLREAQRAGVTSLLCCGYSIAANQAVIALRDRVPSLPIAIGLHPWFANESVQVVQEMLELAKPNAIGECGLDGVEDGTMPSLSRQKAVFEVQLDAALRFGLPVTVHSRKAVQALREVLADFPGVRGVLHAYSGSFEQLHGLLDCGWMVGIGGTVTRPAARKYRRLVAKLPMECLVLETDSPAIGLETVEPPNVRPSHVALVARSVAELKALPLEQVIEQTDKNVRTMFGEAVFASW
jgi:TatD DNase family protein